MKICYQIEIPFESEQFCNKCSNYISIYSNNNNSLPFCDKPENHHHKLCNCGDLFRLSGKKRCSLTEAKILFIVPLLQST